MANERRCNRCGAELIPDTGPRSLCPSCLLNLGLVKQDEGAISGAPSRTNELRDSDVAVPERIGPYLVLRKLGEGGMGEVWEAEQDRPVRRKVALKLIKPGMDTKQVVARFESERQALALMNHPSIARVFEARATEQGRPYFAMEYVEGEPITAHCDRHRLTTGERLELFMQVCDGVQHAHQKGIIHRDIKPSNVLVETLDGKPVPKIIDFGVAKATQRQLTEESVFTRLGVLIGTPEYMSPEQAEMTSLDIDTRTDVYSLGVLLYELLAGVRPFDSRELAQAGFDEIRRRIREDEPSRPSSRVGTLGDGAEEAAAHRHTDPHSLIRLLRGDLDWITMKALEKERDRRYASPGELAADIRRHLEHEPVVAGPPSKLYRSRKFIRRHRVGVGFAATVALLAAGFAVTMTVQAGRIARERDRANQEASTAERVSEFLVELFEMSDPSEALGNKITARQILDGGAGRISATLQDQPLVQARLMGTMGRVYRNLGLYEEAQPLLEESMVRRRELLGDDQLQTLTSMADLASLYLKQGRFEEAERLHTEVLDRRRRALGEDHPSTLASMSLLATVHFERGRYDEAERQYVEVLDARRRTVGDDHPSTLATMHGLGSVYLEQGRFEEAEQMWLDTLEGRRRILGKNHPRTLGTMSNLGSSYYKLGRYKEAQELHADTLERRRSVLGPEHPETLDSMHNLANSHLVLRQLEEAEGLHSATLEIRRRVLGDEHPRTLISMNSLATVYMTQKRFEEAGRLFGETLEISRRVRGEEHPATILSMANLALLRMRLGRFEEAEGLGLEALELQRRVHGATHRQTLRSMRGLIRLYRGTRQPEKERSMVQELLGAMRAAAEESGAGADAKNDYAWELLICRPTDLRDARTALQFALDANELGNHEDPNHLDTLALAYHSTERTAQAIETMKLAISLLGEGAKDRGQYEERLAEYEAALETQQSEPDEHAAPTAASD